MKSVAEKSIGIKTYFSLQVSPEQQAARQKISRTAAPCTVVTENEHAV
jgi:hypothetical protein